MADGTCGHVAEPHVRVGRVGVAESAKEHRPNGHNVASAQRWLLHAEIVREPVRIVEPDAAVSISDGFGCDQVVAIRDANPLVFVNRGSDCNRVPRVVPSEHVFGPREMAELPLATETRLHNADPKERGRISDEFRQAVVLHPLVRENRRLKAPHTRESVDDEELWIKRDPLASDHTLRRCKHAVACSDLLK